MNESKNEPQPRTHFAICQCSCHKDGGTWCGGVCCDGYSKPVTTDAASRLPAEEGAAKVLEFRDKREYRATSFKAQTIAGEFIASGTLCGHLDFVIPVGGKTITRLLLPEDAKAIAEMLAGCAVDVLENSRPYDDPRIYEKKVQGPCVVPYASFHSDGKNEIVADQISTSETSAPPEAEQPKDEREELKRLAAEEPNAEDWRQANALKHLELLNESHLRAAYRELSAYNFMYLRLLAASQPSGERGDGSCDHCGAVPALVMDTSLCDECRDGVKRAELAERQLDALRSEPSGEREKAIRDLMHDLWCVGLRLRDELKDALVIHPENWHEAALNQWLERWDASAGKYADMFLGSSPKPEPTQGNE